MHDSELSIGMQVIDPDGRTGVVFSIGRHVGVAFDLGDGDASIGSLDASQLAAKFPGNSTKSDGNFDRAAARARCEAATPGPWRDGGPPYCEVQAPVALLVAATVSRRSDRDFIANARQDLPAALDLLDRCAAMLADLEWEKQKQGAKRCPRCQRNSSRQLHRDGCDLDSLLRELEGGRFGYTEPTRSKPQ